MRILDCNWWMLKATGDETKPMAEVVGWPTPTADKNMYQTVTAHLAEYKAAGFTHLLLPPPCLGAAGRYSGGYDLKDNYILSGTAFGEEKDLLTLATLAEEKGLALGLDLTLHQYDGYPNQNYITAHFPKTPKCFAAGIGQKPRPGNQTPDDVPDMEGNWPDGDLAAYQHDPDKYMWKNTIKWVQDLIKLVGYKFIRVDEAKGLHAPFVKALLNSDGINDLFAFGEYFDGNPTALSGWVNYWMGRRASVLDFNFKFNAQNVCNNSSRVWMGNLSDCGYCLRDSMKSVTFLESHDTDNSQGEQVIWNKMLGYAMMLTYPGAPMVYYRDWASDKFCYDLKERINNLLWIHEHLAQGDYVVRLSTDYQVFAHERTGFGKAPGCVCFFNNDQWNEHTHTVHTRYSAGTRLHEYTGNGGYANDRWVDNNGNITVTTPRNYNGLGYIIYGVYL